MSSTGCLLVASPGLDPGTFGSHDMSPTNCHCSKTLLIYRPPLFASIYRQAGAARRSAVPRLCRPSSGPPERSDAAPEAGSLSHQKRACTAPFWASPCSHRRDTTGEPTTPSPLPRSALHVFQRIRACIPAVAVRCASFRPGVCLLHEQQRCCFRFIRLRRRCPQPRSTGETPSY